MPTPRFLPVLGALAAMPVLLAAPAMGAARPEKPAAAQWVAGWYSAPYAPVSLAAGATPAIFANQTVRQILRVDTGGEAIRLRLSNELGATPLKVGAVHVALVDDKGEVVAGSDHAVSFGGKAGVWMPTGAPMFSDPLPIRIAPLQHLAVSVWYDASAMPAAHLAALTVAPGNQTAAAAMNGAVPRRGPAIVSGVDVLRGGRAPVIVTFGDSITEGAASTPGKDMSWPQQFAARLAADAATREWSVVNSGISGNRVLHEGFTLPALARFDRDVLSVSGVTHVVLLEGINDIGWWNKPESDMTAEQLIEAYRQIVQRAHAHHIKVIGATILPYKGAIYYTPEGEVMRQTVNAFIRTGGLFDAVIDFESAMADPADKQRLRPDFEPGDHLHPNDAGYRAMAQAVPVEIFAR